MVQCCAVVGCKANSRRNNEVRFYCFPTDKNPDIRKQWIVKLNRQYADGSAWEPKYFHKVCSRHFKEGRPTPQNPYPDQNLSPDGEDKADVVPVAPRRRARFTEPATPKSESAETKISPEGKRKISPKSDPVTPVKTSPASSDSSGVTPSKRLRSSDDAATVKKEPVSEPSVETEDNEGDGAGPDAPQRHSGRKRKRRVFNTASDEEVINNIVEEPETYVIWRRRQPAPAESEPEPEPQPHTSGYRMRSRRSIEEQPAQPEEVEPEVFPAGQRKRLLVKDEDGEEEEKDSFCWLCHKEGTDLACELCMRGFHLKCLDINQACPSWVCTECEKTMRAECVDTRSHAMALLTLDQLCVILRFALSQMRIPGSEPFFHPVDKIALPLYEDFIANPTDFSTLEKNIRRKMYGSTEAFLADVRWLLHNSIVFNGSTHKLTTVARAIVRICKQEISDIEGCPDCYMNAWIKQDKNWFVEPCRIPHTLVWAKLKGYPFWPGKALNEESGQTDVRFFGAHDRAWVPTSNVLMMSREAPVDLKNKRFGMEKAMEELSVHIKKLEEKFGSFKYSAPNVPYDPHISYGYIVKGAVIKKDEDPPVKTETKTEEDKDTSVKSETNSEDKKTSKEEDTYLQELSVGQGLSLSDETDCIVTGDQTYKSHSITEGSTEGSKEVRYGTVSSVSGDRSLMDDTSMNTPPLSDRLSSTETDDKPPVSPHSPKPVTSSTQKDDDPRLAGLSIIERLELKMLEADREEEELQARELAAQKAEQKKADAEGSGQGIDPSTSDGAQAKALLDSEREAEIEGELSLANVESEFKAPADVESEIDLAKVSLVGVPKKNPMLDDLVNSCKAKLGIDSDEELKLETSPSLEAEDGEEGTSSSSPRTVSSLHTRQDEEEEEEGEEEEGDEEEEEESSDSEDTEEEGEEDEEEKSDEENMEGAGEDGVKAKEGEEAMQLEDKAEKETSPEDSELEKNPELEAELNMPDSAVVKEDSLAATEKEAEEEINSDKPSNDEDNNSSEPTTTDPATEPPAEPSNDPETEDSGPPALEILNSQSISPDTFAAASKTLDEEMVAESSDLNKPESETMSDKVDTPTTEQAPLGQSMEIDNDTNDALKLGEAEKMSDFDAERIEESTKTWSLSVNAEKNSMESTDLECHEKNLIDSESPTPSSSSAPSPIDTLQSSITKKFPSRLLEELVKSCPPQPSLAGERDMPQMEGRGGEQESQSFQPPSGDQNAPGSSSTGAPISSDRSGGQVEDSQDGAVGRQLGSAPLNDSLEIPIEVVTAGTSDIDFPSSLHGEGSISKPSGINVEKYVTKAKGAVQSIFQEMLDDFMSSDLGQDSVKSVREEMSRMKWFHEQELLETQHNAQLTMAEMRMMLEHEHTCKMKKLIQLHEEEREKTVEEVKRKQWCASCGKEANFYCCWNTSYCDYPCQQKHWVKHMLFCMQTPTTQTQVVIPPSVVQDSPAPAPIVVPTSPAILSGSKVVSPPDKTVWESIVSDPKIMRRHRGEASRVPGVQYVQQTSQATSPVTVSKTKPTSLTVGKTLKIANTTGAVAAVQYFPNQITGATPDAGAPRTVIAGQTSGSGGSVPVMYQFVPRFPQSSAQNIRIMSPQTVQPRATATQLTFHPSKV